MVEQGDFHTNVKDISEWKAELNEFFMPRDKWTGYRASKDHEAMGPWDISEGYI